jgi:membrane protein implicated in regulation of membrane protease activity
MSLHQTTDADTHAKAWLWYVLKVQIGVGVAITVASYASIPLGAVVSVILSLVALYVIARRLFRHVATITEVQTRSGSETPSD